MSTIKVTKRDGSLEDFDAEKIHKIINWAIGDYSGVAVSDVAMHAQLQLYEEIPTEEIHRVLIKSAADLVSLDAPNYQYVAARLLLYELRKQVWGGPDAPRLWDHIKQNVDDMIYDEYILEHYSKSEINKLNNKVNHDRDYVFTYSGLQQLIDKYLVKDRSSGEIFETPQFAYMLIAMTLFAKYPKETRNSYVVKAYDYFSKHKINLPTPIMAGVRTPIRQYSSCVLIDIDDSLPSIFSSATAVGYYTARRAGIGVNIGRIRPIGSSIRNGEVVHTGVIPFLKVIESTAKSCSQNGIRGGGATVSCPWWHYEIEDIMVLKNNAGTDDNRVRKLDYCIQFEELFYERVKENKDITLFSPAECGGLYEAFGTSMFKELYEKYERSRSLKFKKKIKARKLLELFLRERIETGRIYFMNIDHANKRGPWKSKVNMTNLCVEILQPTTPIQHIDDEDGEIGICTLSAINLLEIKSEEQLETACDIIIRLLDAVLDHQEYPVKAGENFATNRRSLGVGITNLAGLLAKSKARYDSQEALEIVDEWCENVQYYLLKASNNLARETSPCSRFSDTKYADGILPMDLACENSNKLVKRKPRKDWDSLRASIQEAGLRHSTVTAVMPAESSSVIQNSTNGIEPVRSLISYKKAKNGVLKQIVPGYHHYKNFYTMAWDITDNSCINNICATIQKWFDMGISMNHYYNYAHHDADKGIPLSTLAKDLIKAHELGIRTGYYANTNDGDKSVDLETEANQQEEMCAGGACSI